MATCELYSEMAELAKLCAKMISILLQEKVSELQKEVQWHQESASGARREEKAAMKAFPIKKTGGHKGKLPTQQQLLQHGTTTSNHFSNIGKKYDENVCQNAVEVIDDKQHPNLSTAQAIQMAVDCQNGR